MKRHPSLQELSRDHHHGLVHARHFRQTTLRTLSARHHELQGFWNGDLARHFREEEEILLPLAARRVDAEDAEFRRLLTDHLRMRHWVHELQSGAGSEAQQVELFHHLGRCLEAHIRFEERELFPRLEQVLNADDLADLDRDLERSARESPRRATCVVTR